MSPRETRGRTQSQPPLRTGLTGQMRRQTTAHRPPRREECGARGAGRTDVNVDSAWSRSALGQIVMRIRDNLIYGRSQWHWATGEAIGGQLCCFARNIQESPPIQQSPRRLLQDTKISVWWTLWYISVVLLGGVEVARERGDKSAPVYTRGERNTKPIKNRVGTVMCRLSWAGNDLIPKRWY